MYRSSLPYTNSPNPFKPAFQYLLAAAAGERSAWPPPLRQSTLNEVERQSGDGSHESAAMSHQRLSIPDAGPVSLINISPSPSLYPRKPPSSLPSDEEDDEDVDYISAGRPLVASNIGSGGRSWKRVFRNGRVGSWLFGTCEGWQVYVGIVVFWVLGCGFGLQLMNRFILWTGVYRFPYPLTTTLIELILTHILLLLTASLTRSLERPLTSLGLACVIAPRYPLPPPSSPAGFRSSGKAVSGWIRFSRWFAGGSGGIAGGGFLEFEWNVVSKVLLLAGIYIGKIILSNLSYAYAPLEMYTLARIGVVPVSFSLTAFITRTSHSISILSSALTATLNLLIASIRPGHPVSWESVVAGVFSTLFVALYPIILLRVYRNLVTMQNPQTELFTGFIQNVAINPANASCSKEETRAGWRTLHYTSLLSIILLFPIVLLSGEIGNISRNCYFLDVPWFWFMMLCGGVGSWSVFFSTLLLVKATSPLTAVFLFVPRSAFQLVVLSRFKLPVFSWVGVGMCWLASLWFLTARRGEGRTLARLSIAGQSR